MLVRYKNYFKHAIHSSASCMDGQEVSGHLLNETGNIASFPVGLLYATVEVQGVSKHKVRILIVDDHAILFSLLLGHTFTEKPTIKIVKNDSDFIFVKVEQHNNTMKCPLPCPRKVLRFLS